MALLDLSLSRLSSRLTGRSHLPAEPAAAKPSPVLPLPEALAFLHKHVPWFGPAYTHSFHAMNAWAHDPMRALPPECFVGKDVLDIGCGNGASSALFLERGAQSVWGVDPEVLSDQHLEWLSVLPNAKFQRERLEAHVFGGRKPLFDLAFAHWVTEHVSDMADHLALIYDLLKPGGRYVALHDNYYAPMGGHDHGYMGPDAEDHNKIASQAPKCWESERKCEASAEFRERVAREQDANMRKWTLTPSNCERCPHYQRAQVWGHLIYSDQWAATYGSRYGYRTGLGLNKITPFQIKQLLIEAGFEIEVWYLNKVANVPPPELAARFPLDDLTAMGVLMAGVKK